MSASVILLIGMMGAGKTTVGKTISQLTGWPYLDNDELVEQATGHAAPALLAAGGEQSLRAAETAALHRALGMRPPTVAGVAGGVVLDAANREPLRRARTVVWLRARPQTLLQRVGDGTGRAWLQPDPATAISRLVTTRDPLYAEVADAVVNVDDLSAAEAAAAVLAETERI